MQKGFRPALQKTMTKMKPCIIVETCHSTIAGKGPQERRLRITPTKSERRSVVKSVDLRLKESIAVRLL